MKTAKAPLQTARGLHRRCRAVMFSGTEGRDRTGDTGIFSAVLYQLSYLGVAYLAGDAAFVGDRGLEPLTSTV